MTEEKINIEGEEALDMEQKENETAEQNSGNESADIENDSSENGTEGESENEGESKAEASEEQDPLAAAQAQIEELRDKYLRSVAEFDNYRKRTLKEKTELILNGGEKTITAILPVIDDMERAIGINAKTDDPQAIREGIELIFNKFVKILESLGVKEIETADADFDTDIHEAISMVPGMGDDKKGKVIDCVQKGYKLNDKVIRHAKVAVGQ